MRFLIVLLCASSVQGAVLSFDGNDQVMIPNSPSLNPSEITIEVWVNFARLAIDWPNSGVRAQELVSKGFDDVPGQFSLRQDRGPENLQFLIDDKANWAWARASVPLVVDQWYHIAGTYDGDRLQLYVDGVVVASNLVGSHQLGNLSPLYFGYHDRPRYPYNLDGQLDEVRIWNYARSESEIRATMGVDALTGTEPGLVGYWNFEEGPESQTVFDLTANGNHGYLGTTSSVDGSDPMRIPEPSTLALLILAAVMAAGVGLYRLVT